MSRTATYNTTVTWKGEHWGHLHMGNGPAMTFSAPPESHGHEGVLTPEDAFVAAVNTCIMMMFIWTTERFKLDLVSYECYAEGTKLIELDQTEIFTEVLLHPNIVVRCELSQKEITEKRIMRALETAQKYSLVANSIKPRVVIVPDLKLMHGELSGQI
jgi:organic hydroperoxide reductase OsmC/OhrA